MPYTVLNPATAATAPSTTVGNPLTSVGETLATFQAELLVMLGNRADATPSRMTSWINKAYTNLAAMLDIKELEGSVALSLVVDQPFYLIPTVVSYIKRLSIVDTTNYAEGGREMEMIDEPTYRTLPVSSYLGTGTQVWPTSYFRYGRMVVVYPTPGTSYTVSMDFKIRPARLSVSTDSPILPEEFHEVILLMALARANRMFKLYKEAALAQNDALVVLRPLLNTDAEERDAMHMVAQPVRTSRDLYRR